jgi:high-affinity nickel-transport protein
VVNLRNFWNGWKGNALDEHIHDPVERGASRQHLFHTHDEPARSVNLMDRALGDWRVYQWARPLIVGLVHGLAGSAAVALLVLATVHNARWAIAYLFLFGLGTIAGMMIITMAIASALHLASRHSAWIHRKLVVTTGLLSVFFGLFIVYQMGYVHGLFTAHPGWTPQ